MRSLLPVILPHTLQRLRPQPCSWEEGLTKRQRRLFIRDDIGSRKGRGPASGEDRRNKQPSLYL